MSVMPGRSRSKNGVASLACSRSKNGVASLAYGPGHPRLSCWASVKTWMPVTSAGMTSQRNMRPL